MKLLVDESVQHALVGVLNDAGHDAVHVLGLDMQGAPDEDVLSAAADEGRTLITADTDFGTLLALSNAAARASSCSADQDAELPSVHN